MGGAFSGTNVAFISGGVKYVESGPKDLRRRNSLVFFLTQWQQCDSEAAEAAALLAVQQHWKAYEKANPIQTDPIIERANQRAKLIAQGDFRQLRDQVIQKWGEVNKFWGGSMQGDTLLHIVCREGYDRMLQFMLDPNSRSPFETQVLDLNVLNKMKRTALMLCFTPPALTTVARTWGLEHDADAGLTLPKGQRPEAAVMASDWVKPGARANREACICLLTAAGANTNILDMHDYSCLHYAAMLGWDDAVDALLKHKANPLHKCITGETALHFAMEWDHGSVAETLLLASPGLQNESDKDGSRPIHTAIRCKRDRQFIELLVDHGADLNSPDYSGVTPLKLACSLQNVEAVETLLDLKVVQDAEGLELLEGAAADTIRRRLNKEAQEQARVAALKDDAIATSAQREVQRAYGAWVPYLDKLSKNIFYYNKVSRESRWDVPPGYVKDLAHIPKPVTFGMSFYH